MPRPPSAGLLVGCLLGGQDATPSQCRLACGLLIGRARCHALPVQTCWWLADGRFYELLAEEEVEVAFGGGLDP